MKKLSIILVISGALLNHAFAKDAAHDSMPLLTLKQPWPDNKDYLLLKATLKQLSDAFPDLPETVQIISDRVLEILSEGGRFESTTLFDTQYETVGLGLWMEMFSPMKRKHIKRIIKIQRLLYEINLLKEEIEHSGLSSSSLPKLLPKSVQGVV